VIECFCGALLATARASQKAETKVHRPLRPNCVDDFLKISCQKFSYSLFRVETAKDGLGRFRGMDDWRKWANNDGRVTSPFLQGADLQYTYDRAHLFFRDDRRRFVERVHRSRMAQDQRFGGCSLADPHIKVYAKKALVGRSKRIFSGWVWSSNCA
jgi:hypothetical protein